MISIGISWELIKIKELPFRYADANGNYYIYCLSETTEYSCVIPKGTVESSDFENTYKDSATPV